jgi:hypothetical protein
MSRWGRRGRDKRGANGSRSNSARGDDAVTLRDLRFETPEASEMFFTLRYLHPEFVGVRVDGVRLPPITESASTTSSSGGMVYKAFPHGLMFGDQMSLMAGGGLFLAAVLAFPLSMHLIFGGNSLVYDMYSSIGDAEPFAVVSLVILAVLMLGMSPFFLLVILEDLIGFRFATSALFDRNAGKVHIFSDLCMPWAPWRYGLKSYDWQCVRADIDTLTMFGGPIVRREAGLRCVIMDRPGGDKVVDEFVLGINMPATKVQPLLDTWEHVRRFMQREGPLFADQHDTPNPYLGRQSLWRHMLTVAKFELYGTKDMLRIAKEDKDFSAAFAGLLGIILIPFLWIPMLWGFLPWLSGLAKREPTWPAEIIASVGGASLRGADLEAWRGLVPEKGQQLVGEQARIDSN